MIAEAGCYTCDENAQSDPAPWQSIHRDAHWRLAHSFNSSLPGWLVALPLRHVTAIHELTTEEAAVLGALLHRASVALRAVTGCTKTYVMQFAEGEGFTHVHFHIVPRMREFAADVRGPKVFTFLKESQDERVSVAERDRIAAKIRTELTTLG